MKGVYQIKEYGSFITGREIEGFVTLPKRTFEQLENFILTNNSRGTAALELMGISARKGIGRIITAKNYVGIITMKDGTAIEILPKIYSGAEDDAYTVDRPENRIIKTTLLYLYRHTTSSKNKKNLKNLLNCFNRVDVSENIKSDFSKCVPDRSVKNYAAALLWSRVFLEGKSFTAFTGTEDAMALLFPMEMLFESYVGALLKRRLPKSRYMVSVQDKSCHLFDKPYKKFLLKPDIVVQRKDDEAIFVLDTKWKILSKGIANYGISQSDMYQMYAYQKKYHANSATLVYPRTEGISPEQKLEFCSSDGAVVRVCFIDLFRVDSSIEEICCLLE